MRKALSFVVMLAVLVTACSTTQPVMKQDPNSPCNDARLLELKKKDFSQLSEREFEYLKDKEKACDEYNRMTKQMQQTQEMTDSVQSGWLTYYLIAAGIGLVGLIYVMTAYP